MKIGFGKDIRAEKTLNEKTREGSVIIAVGSALIALSTHLSHDRDRRIFLTAFIMIITGMCFMLYFSSSGSFGGESTLSWSWSTLILPYIIG